MPSFGQKSLARLDECHPEIQRVMREAITDGPDFSIVCGYRSVEEQQRLYAQGRTTPGDIVTKVDGINTLSKHNQRPAMAVDIVPWPSGYKDRQRFLIVGSYIMGVANVLGVRLHWGADWDRDWNMEEHPFVDLPHFELR